jgi:hypothetical protein
MIATGVTPTPTLTRLLAEVLRAPRWPERAITASGCKGTGGGRPNW